VGVNRSCVTRAAGLESVAYLARLDRFDHFLTVNPCVTGGKLLAGIVTRYERDMIRAAQMGSAWPPDAERD
jgi:hypothetical protein